MPVDLKKTSDAGLIALAGIGLPAANDTTR
jgi:hypothetical protein